MQALPDDLLEISLHVVRHLGKLLVEYLGLQLFHLCGFPRVPLRAEFVEDHSKSPDVRCLGVWLVLPELGRQVKRRPHFLVLPLLLVLLLLLVDAFYLANLFQCLSVIVQPLELFVLFRQPLAIA